MVLNSISPWAPAANDHLQQLLDVLHVCHMWDIRPGIDFAADELRSKFELRPAHSLHLAERYRLVDWVNDAVRSLLDKPLQVCSLTIFSEYLFTSFF